ncbi:hypothetical protein F4776DRAFT_640033 [Hypoxylon sp. NC0597]|nr:hypothetical protein F4776DRAFT_640033 [Hypoxylon sp. NC0597]
MADDPTSVEIGMEAWTKAIDQIDVVAENGFGDFEAAGHRSIGAYYVSLYTTLKNTMGEISNEFYKDDKANEKALFKRAVGILDKFHKYAQGSREALLETKNFHYKLWIRLDDFGHQPWTSYDIDIQKHIQRMIVLTVGLQPPFEQAWKDGDLINHKRFQVAYESFLQLDDKNAYDDVERRNFVLRSQQLVQQALIGLRLLTVSTDLQVNWTNNEIRPTYVDFPYGSEEYFYGLGSRPGVLNIKLKLGGKITPEERKKMKKATKKRPAPASAPEQRQGKRPRPNWGYTMTMENVDADIEDIYHDAAFRNVTKRPSADILVTPLTANRATTLANYRDDLTKIIRRHRSAYYKPETPPTSQVDRDRLIERIEKEIPALRDMAKEVRTSSTAKLKRAKLAAFSLRFLRALHMKLVLSSTPPVSNEQMNRALTGRMEDWSTFERTWNESDAKTRLIPRLTLELQREIDDAFRARSANILDWTLLLNQLRSGLGPDVPEEPEPPQERQEPEESPDQNQPKEQTKVSYKLDPNDTTMWFIEPRRPARSVYVSEKIDRRQEERARARAIDSALMQTGKKEGRLHRLEEKYRAEDKLSDAVAAALAKKGPPDYAKIPVETVLEKITYMIVIHHWRLFQTARIL